MIYSHLLDVLYIWHLKTFNWKHNNWNYYFQRLLYYDYINFLFINMLIKLFIVIFEFFFVNNKERNHILGKISEILQKWSLETNTEKRKGKRSDLVTWHKSLPNVTAPHNEGKPTTKFDYTTNADRLMRVSFGDYVHPTCVVNENSLATLGTAFKL